MSEIKKTEPLHIQAYHIVREKIIKGEYQPNERLVESRLAEQLGISRGTVREAIRLLTKDELLVNKENSIYVYNPSRQDIQDIFECRRSLESLAVKLAAQNISDEQIMELERIIKDSKEALANNDAKQHANLNQQFHDTIVVSSQNKQLVQLFEVINAKVLYIRNCILTEHPCSLWELINDHEQILQALQERDSVKAEGFMNKHIERSLEVVHSS